MVEIDARKEKIGEEEAWQLLKTGAAVYVGRQKSFSKFIPADENRAEMMSQVMGRSGNLRAPTLKSGQVFLVGFAEEMYLQQL